MKRPLGPLSGAAAVWGPIGVALITFTTTLEQTIVNVSVPAIAGDLAVSPSQGAWVVSAFVIANAMTVPLTGWLTQRLGQVRLLLGSFFMFLVCSALCGLAPSLEVLVLLRVLTGLAAGPLMPLTQTVLLASYPVHKAGMAIGMWTMISLFAPVMGPIVGGLIVDSASWRWIFLIRLPVGLVVLGMCWAVYRNRESEIRRLPVDAVGLSLLLAWVAMLQLGLDLGKELDWFDSPLIIALACGAVAGFLLFMAWELFDNPHPVVELALFRRRNFALGTLALTLAQSIFFASNVLLPLWMQTVLGYSATLAGLLVAPMGLLAIPMSMLLARNIERLDARWLTTCALLLFAYVWWLRAEFTLQVEPWMIAVPALLQGIAMTSHFLPLTRITLDGLPPESYAAGAGLMMFIRQTGSALGISVTITMWDLRTQVHRAELLERASIYDSATGQTLDLLQGSGLGATQSLAMLDRMIEQQARMLATSDIFWASAVMSLVLAGFVWLVSPKGGRITLPAMSKAVSE